LLEEYFFTNLPSSGTPKLPRNIPDLRTANKKNRRSAWGSKTSGAEESIYFLFTEEETSFVVLMRDLKYFNLSSRA
jgi:hypothetical protein